MYSAIFLYFFELGLSSVVADFGKFAFLKIKFAKMQRKLLPMQDFG